MFSFFRQFKGRLRGVEVASVATQEVNLSLARMSSARSKEVRGAFYAASRQLRGRSEQKTKRIEKLNRVQVKCLKWLGIYWVVEDQAADLKAVANHFRFAGDVQNKLSDQWTGLHFEGAAADIDSRIPVVLERIGKEGAEDMGAAAGMVRNMRQLVDPTVKNEGGDDTSQVSASKG